MIGRAKIFPIRNIALAGILLRTFAGDGWGDIGWKLNLRGNLYGYAAALIGFAF